ncbi:uncharacterized protein LY79DRAFT_367077 [Colletotrichum navitas]|uniref:Uncharacterized protein n=1 Tax=Colletotrichum navitas TaxID=681940 RepID=A0AAD8PQE6_9PEZI|nr:uncharacterized protein LY79DRAFT_367077 [Colletotrichum navitas]KAK1574465.1 hypothetical protein LY79DRAFT_367077 [Colletotrichum navitas]
MERPHRPPPLTIPPPVQSRTRIRRPRRPNARQARQFKLWLLRAQIANDVAHVVGASILLWIMSWFLYNVPLPIANRTGPAAIALLVVLSVDVLLDARSIVHAHDAWPGWALLLRLIVGASAIVVFWVYIALGEVFAPGFTYWDMTEMHGRVLAYMFLWGIGLWDLLFVVLCRHWLGKEVKRYGGRARRAIRDHREETMSPGVSAHRLVSPTAEEPPNRIVTIMDVEAARPVNEDAGSGGGRVSLPPRMGTRRVKSSISVSVNSIVTSGTETTDMGMVTGARTGTGTVMRSASPPPPPVFLRPA